MNRFLFSGPVWTIGVSLLALALGFFLPLVIGLRIVADDGAGGRQPALVIVHEEAVRPPSSRVADGTATLAVVSAAAGEQLYNSYCVACYAESRAFAQEFLGRVAARHGGIESLQLAADAYVPTVDAMNRLVELFPFPGKAGEAITDPIAIAEAVDILRAARDGEAEALAHLGEAVAAEWGEA